MKMRGSSVRSIPQGQAQSRYLCVALWSYRRLPLQKGRQCPVRRRWPHCIFHQVKRRESISPSRHCHVIALKYTTGLVPCERTLESARNFTKLEAKSLSLHRAVVISTASGVKTPISPVRCSRFCGESSTRLSFPPPRCAHTSPSRHRNRPVTSESSGPIQAQIWHLSVASWSYQRLQT